MPREYQSGLMSHPVSPVSSTAVSLALRPTTSDFQPPPPPPPFETLSLATPTPSLFRRFTAPVLPASVLHNLRHPHNYVARDPTRETYTTTSTPTTNSPETETEGWSPSPSPFRKHRLLHSQPIFPSSLPPDFSLLFSFFESLFTFRKPCPLLFPLFWIFSLCILPCISSRFRSLPRNHKVLSVLFQLYTLFPRT